MFLLNFNNRGSCQISRLRNRGVNVSEDDLLLIFRNREGGDTASDTRKLNVNVNMLLVYQMRVFCGKIMFITRTEKVRPSGAEIIRYNPMRSSSRSKTIHANLADRGILI